MLDFSTADLHTLLDPAGHACACGRRHRAPLRGVHIGPGAIEALPGALSAAGIARPFVVCDENTYRAAGARAAQGLDSAHISYTLFVFPDQEGPIEPDERAVGSLTMALPPEADGVVAVGSGVLNDCCKVLCHAARLPLLVVATAPSMDGYASNSSSMIQNRVKVSLYNLCPAVILADTDILCQAPMEMLRAGLGDMLAKYVSVCEWRISHLVTGEYYCENIASLVRASLKRCVASAQGLIDRDETAVRAVMEGLILSGVAMSFAEISRPASGLEHYFSHLWEMMALERGEKSRLHGVQVGVGTALTLSLLDRVRSITPSREAAAAAMRAFSQDLWEAEMRGIFGAAAPQVIRAEQTVHRKNDPTRHEKRLDTLIAHWDDILAILRRELPDTKEILSLMQSLGMATRPEDIGISRADTKKALIGSREIRDKYLTSSMLWDLGLLRQFADRLADETPA